MGAINGAETVHPSIASEFIPRFLMTPSDGNI
jgi:hypothetical protein